MHAFRAFVFTYRGAIVPLALTPALLLPAAPGGWCPASAVVLLVALGAFFRLGGIRLIGGRAHVHSAGTRELFTRGLYSHTRNPLYIGNALVAAGAAAILGSTWSAPAVFALLVGLYTVVILHEEGALVTQYGKPYRDYMAAVPRWGPKLVGAPSAGGPVERTPWLELLRLERWFSLSCLFLVAGAPFVPGVAAGDISIAGRAVPIRLLLLGFLFLLEIWLFFVVSRKLRRRRRHWLDVGRVTGKRSPPRSDGAAETAEP